jgi:hypothetical protein
MIKILSFYFSAEASWRAFDGLKTVISQLKNAGLEESDAVKLIGCVDSLKNYFKNYLQYDISWESACPEHCAKHALSDPSDKDFRVQIVSL